MKSNIYTIKEKHNPLSVSGNGEKGLIIVLKNEDMKANEATLHGLIKAIKFDIAMDTTLVVLDKLPSDLNTILKSGSHSEVMLIGVSSADVGFSMNAKKNFWYNMEGFSILLTNALSEMNSDKKKKMDFWQKLQEKFLS